ncbi:hypothetical protein [Steroidobacter sp.]|uniref:hypothetical protein n=1 Tax=Steroidobacter sp. TaxID=1978227 RepID=UPI0039C9AB98
MRPAITSLMKRGHENPASTSELYSAMGNERTMAVCRSSICRNCRSASIFSWRMRRFSSCRKRSSAALRSTSTFLRYKSTSTATLERRMTGSTGLKT